MMFIPFHNSHLAQEKNNKIQYPFPMAMSKTSGLVWLCKSCETKGMERLLKDEKQIDAKEQEKIVAKVMEDKLDEIRDTNTKLIEDKLSLFQQNLEAKLENLLSEDRKSAQSWSEVTQRNAPLVKSLGTIMKETIEHWVFFLKGKGEK